MIYQRNDGKTSSISSVVTNPSYRSTTIPSELIKNVHGSLGKFHSLTAVEIMPLDKLPLMS